MKKTLLLAIVCCCTLIAQAQSLEFYKHNLEELASPKMRGRAYDGGDSIAAAFIADVFKQSGAVTIADCFGKNIADSSNINGYFQQVVFPTNEVVKADVYFDGVKARAGYDFIIDATSGSKKGKFEAYYSQDSILKFNETIELFKERGKEIVYIREMSIPSYMLLNSLKYQNVELGGFITINSKELFKKMMQAAGMVDMGMYGDVDALMYSKALMGKQLNNPVFIVDDAKFPRDVKEIEFDIVMHADSAYKSSNVIAVIPGTVNPDSMFVFTAHYDHLGKMDDAYFLGANDNASGTAMLLSLAEFYGRPENKPDNTLVFVAVTGEEMGLLGSREFVVNTPVDLSKIRYVFNFDMVADNADTLSAYSDSIAIRGIELIKEINSNQNHFVDVKYAKYEQNSDHYYFLQNRVPAVCFIFDKGENFTKLHTVKDDKDNISYKSFHKIFDIITQFIDKY